MPEPFDEEALMGHVDGDLDFLQEAVDMLDEDCPPLLDQIAVAVAAGDDVALTKSAHTLKSVLANFCATRATDAARELEAMGRQKQFENAEVTVNRVRVETDQLCEALHAFLRTRGR